MSRDKSEFTIIVPAMNDNLNNNRAKRLTKARIQAGFNSASDFARKYQIPLATYGTHENGSRNYKERDAQKYAKLLGTTYEYLWSGNNNKPVVASVLVVGRMIGGVITTSHPLTGNSMNDHALAEARTVEAPPQSNPAALFSLEVGDNKFAPYIRTGAFVYYNRTPDSIEDCIGELCVIKIKDGPAVFDLLQRGKPGLFDTLHHGRDLKIEWAARKRYQKDA